MILIFSIKGDFSTNEVVRWLGKLNKRYIRLNLSINQVEAISINDKYEEFELLIDGKIKIKSSDVNSVWYRRGGLNLYFPFDDSSESFSQLRELYNDELLLISHYVFDQFSTKRKVLGSTNFSVNKLDVLHIAKRLKLKIPDTLVTNRKAELVQFFHKNKKDIITKSLDQIATINNISTGFGLPTSLVREEDLDSIQDLFFYTLFQENIKKLFEIRVLFLKDKFYAIAIFSQGREESKIDNRIGEISDIRCTSFELPSRIKIKISKLMKRLKLNTGSLDLIYTTKREYVFLEVNPVGQFGYVSRIGNYNIHKEIAQIL